MTEEHLRWADDHEDSLGESDYVRLQRGQGKMMRTRPQLMQHYHVYYDKESTARGIVVSTNDSQAGMLRAENDNLIPQCRDGTVFSNELSNDSLQAPAVNAFFARWDASATLVERPPSCRLLLLATHNARTRCEGPAIKNTSTSSLLNSITPDPDPRRTRHHQLPIYRADTAIFLITRQSCPNLFGSLRMGQHRNRVGSRVKSCEAREQGKVYKV
ncbi:hypothetical protein Hypma_008923 [Hypsizygus marmoreus]|uniref:Uncharacterized protein n=1 Tax=Hypsizygus marmoreus TaxID=39966 RepID=A0A369JMC4_HYPMA|nr:hypothetical protein Hypma_008923 [Hypsizygus marmoreus]